MKNTYLLLIFLFSFVACQNNSEKTSDSNAILANNKTVKAGTIITRIQENVTCEWATKTVDTYKGGNAESPVTGIATTFLATYDVLKRAKEAGLNMIITHEPTFYNHLDETTFFEEDPVYQKKRDFIRDNNMVVFRFHDHWHRTQPDGILIGMTERLGWKQYEVRPNELLFKLPEQSLSQLADYLQGHFGATSVRVVGPKDMMISQVGFSMGSPGSQSQIRVLRMDEVEVLVGGETHEWETVEYVRDAIDQGRKKALILIGHANSEEAGMEYCAEWLKGFIKDVPVQFIPAGDPFWTPAVSEK